MQDEPPRRRIVLLGASNLVRSLSIVVETARLIWQEPVEIMAAIGHGRSYGQNSQVLGRKISGIFSCALWQDLQNRPPLPTAALVTDVGNDLLYEVPIARLMEWVEGCLDQLAAAGATTIERLADFVCAGFPASVTVAVKLNVPVAVGVPEIRPVLEARLSPPGRLPDVTDQV